MMYASLPRQQFKTPINMKTVIHIIIQTVLIVSLFAPAIYNQEEQLTGEFRIPFEEPAPAGQEYMQELPSPEEGSMKLEKLESLGHTLMHWFTIIMEKC